MRLLLARLAGAVGVLSCCHALAPAIPGPSFGIAHKATWLDPSDPRPPGTWAGKDWPVRQEVEVFNHTCDTADVNSAGTVACAMQHLWTGGSWDGYELTRVRYYVDGEASASVDIPIGMGTGQPFNDDDGPWSAGVAFGKTGQPSGTWNNFAIPFGTTIKVTVELLGASPSHRFWIIVRGRVIGDQFPIPGSASMFLPSSARLRTIETTAVPMQPAQFLTIWNTTADYTAVYLVVLQVISAGGPTFLEGCFRVLDGDGECCCPV
jgi:hypothetical protein